MRRGAAESRQFVFKRLLFGSERGVLGLQRLLAFDALAMQDGQAKLQVADLPVIGAALCLEAVVLGAKLSQQGSLVTLRGLGVDLLLVVGRGVRGSVLLVGRAAVR